MRLLLAAVFLTFSVVPSVASSQCFESLEALRQVYLSKHAYYQTMNPFTTPSSQNSTKDWWTNLFEILPSMNRQSTTTSLCWHIRSPGSNRIKQSSSMMIHSESRTNSGTNSLGIGRKTQTGVSTTTNGNSRTKELLKKSSQRSNGGSTTTIP